MDLLSEFEKHYEKQSKFNFQNGVKFWSKFRPELTKFLLENKLDCSNISGLSVIGYDDVEVSIFSYENENLRSDITLEIAEKVDYFVNLLHKCQDILGFEIIEDFECGKWGIWELYQNTDTEREYLSLLNN